MLRDDDWGRTQKAAKFLRKFARHLRGGDNGAVRQMLCHALKDENWSVRWAAAEALAVLGDRAAIPALGACLVDSSWIVQVAAIRGLVELDAATMAERMAPLLQNARASRCGKPRPKRWDNCRKCWRYSRWVKRSSASRMILYDWQHLESICQISPLGARPWLELALSDSLRANTDYCHAAALADA